MAKTKISEFSATASSNTDIDGINLAEGMAPSLVNNAIRELMAQLKDQQDGSSGDPFTVTGNLTASNLQSDTTVLGSTATSSVTISAASVAVPSAFTLSGTSFTLGGTGALTLPSGTTAQRPVGTAGQVRYNSNLSKVETFSAGSWVEFGGAAGASGAIFENNSVINANYTITSGKNGMSAGPVTIANLSCTGKIDNGSGSAGTVLNVTAVDSGGIVIGQIIDGTGVTANTTVTAYGTGTGGVGTYTVNISQNVSSTTLFSGATVTVPNGSRWVVL
jgi:hypothetical protein